MQEKGFKKIEVKNKKCINVIGSEDGLVFRLNFSDKTFVDFINLIFLIHEDSQWRN